MLYIQNFVSVDKYNLIYRSSYTELKIDGEFCKYIAEKYRQKSQQMKTKINKPMMLILYSLGEIKKKRKT